MRIEIPKIVKKMALAEYAEEFGEQVLVVWVNPPREMLNRYNDLVKMVQKVMDETESSKKVRLPEDDISRLNAEMNEIKHKLAAWYAEIWSQGDVPVSAEEVNDLLSAAHESDPAFETWMIDRTLSMIREHREIRKNA